MKLHFLIDVGTGVKDALFNTYFIDVLVLCKRWGRRESASDIVELQAVMICRVLTHVLS